MEETKTLLDARLSRGFSQMDITRATGITNVTLSRVESGLVYPSKTTIWQLESLLGCRLRFDAPQRAIGRPKQMKRMNY